MDGLAYLRFPDVPDGKPAMPVPASVQVGDTVIVDDQVFVCSDREWVYLPPPEYQSPFGPVGPSWMLNVHVSPLPVKPAMSCGCR